MNPFELHLTFRERPEPLPGWTASAITDDPILGPGNKFYLTTYARTYTEAWEKLQHGREDRPTAIRAKIEEVLYDDRVTSSSNG